MICEHHKSPIQEEITNLLIGSIMHSKLNGCQLITRKFSSYYIQHTSHQV